MGQLADRLAFLTTRYGSDAAAWQHEIHALAALEESDVKQALERFHGLKRRLAEFRRAQLMRELRAFPFVAEVPSEDARGYPLNEVEADIRAATRALSHAKAIKRAAREEAEARASLRTRTLPPAVALPSTRWDDLATLAGEVESGRRGVMREARLDRQLASVVARASKLRHVRVAPPDPQLSSDALGPALDAAEVELDAAERIEEAYADAIAPLKAPEVATFRHESRRALEREAKVLLDRRDVDGLRSLSERTQTLRKEAAGLASQAARSRRAGLRAPEGERRPGDGIDPYG